jgi:DUF4097 and DUF4098 domain-containing protein YvlB
MPVRHISVALALVAGLAFAPTVSARAAQETETIDRTVPFPASGTLKLSTFSGRVTITATNGRDVVIKAVRRGTRDRLDHIKLDISTTGSTVRIDANKRDDSWHDDHDNVVSTDFDIQVPASAVLDVNSFSSPVSVTGIAGNQRLKTFSAKIEVIRAKGAIDAETFNGAIDVDAAGAGTEPDLNLHTFSGDISARLDPNAKGSVEFESFSGRLDSDVPLMMHSSSRRNVRGELNGGTGRTIKLQTFSGDVKLRK